MGFKQSKNLSKAVVPWEQVAATAGESYVVGEALTVTGGLVTKCAPAVMPEFIAQQKLDVAMAGSEITVSRVTELQELETTAAVAMAGVVVGDKVTLHTDGEQITATKTNGVFYVSAIDGTAVGDCVRGYFRR